MPTYECCTFIGSVVALDAADGTRIWKTRTIQEEPQPTVRNSQGTQLWGPSGAAIWSAPTLDPERNRLYVATGDSYTEPAAPESDAIMALAMDTGRILWTQQTLPGDAWNIACFETTPEGRANCPEDAGPDYDFGIPRPDHHATRELLLAGQNGRARTPRPRDGEDRRGDAGRDGGIPRRHRVGLRHRGELTYAASSETLEKGRACRRPPAVRRRRRDGPGPPRPSRHLRLAGRVQHGPAGGGHQHPRRRLLGQPRRPPARLRHRHRPRHLGRRHRRRRRDGQRRAGPRRLAERSRPDGGGRDALRQFRLRRFGLHAGQRPARLRGRGGRAVERRQGRRYAVRAPAQSWNAGSDRNKSTRCGY